MSVIDKGPTILIFLLSKQLIQILWNLVLIAQCTYFLHYW